MIICTPRSHTCPAKRRELIAIARRGGSLTPEYFRDKVAPHMKCGRLCVLEDAQWVCVDILSKRLFSFSLYPAQDARMLKIALLLFYFFCSGKKTLLAVAHSIGC